MRAPRAFATAAILLSLAGCDSFRSREFIECRDGLLRKLKAPSTFKLIKSERTSMNTLTPPEVWVSIEYDAENSYGALLRDKELCQYAATANGQVDWAKIDRDREAETDRLLKQYESEAKATATPIATASASPKPSRFPYVAPDGVDIRNAADEANWKKYRTTDPRDGE